MTRQDSNSHREFILVELKFNLRGHSHGAKPMRHNIFVEVAVTFVFALYKCTLIAYSDRTYVGTGPGPVAEWITVIYRPQRSWAKAMFLQVCVILFTGGGVSASVHARIPHTLGSRHPPGADPPEQTPPWNRHSTSPHPLGADTHPPGADTPLGADPMEQTPLRADTPQEQTPPPGADTPRESRPPPKKADYCIRSTSGRYASYWNAFLFVKRSHCNLCGNLKWVLYFGIVSVPVPVTFPHKFSLNKP